MIKRILKRKLKNFLSLKTVYVLLNLLFVFAIMFVFLLSKKDPVINVFAFLFMFLVYKAFENLLDEVKREERKEIKITRRFTHKNDETGAIEVKKEDFQQAILRLYEFENKIEV